MCSIPGMKDIVQSISETCDHTAGTRIESLSSRSFWFLRSSRPAQLIYVQQRFEPREFTKECKFYDAGRTISLFGDDQFREAPILFGWLVNLLSKDEHHEIGVLFD